MILFLITISTTHSSQRKHILENNSNKIELTMFLFTIAEMSLKTNYRFSDLILRDNIIECISSTANWSFDYS